MLAGILLGTLVLINPTHICAHPTLLPRRHLLAPASKPLAALGDDGTSFSASGIPSDLQSSVECKAAKTGSVPEPLVCIFKNVLLYKGSFHYISPTKAADGWALSLMQPGGARVSR